MEADKDPWPGPAVGRPSGCTVNFHSTQTQESPGQRGLVKLDPGRGELWAQSKCPSQRPPGKPHLRPGGEEGQDQAPTADQELPGFRAPFACRGRKLPCWGSGLKEAGGDKVLFTDSWVPDLGQTP